MQSLPYTVVRDLVKTGDGIFMRGSGLLATGILHFTDLSHVAPVVRYDDIMPHYPVECVQLIEALARGLTQNDFTARIADETAKGSEIYWLSIDLSAAQRFRFREFAMVEITKHPPYAKNDLIRMAFGYVPFGDIDNGMVCSAWHAAGLVACGLVDWQVAPKPGDLVTWLGKRARPLVRIIGPKENEAL